MKLETVKTFILTILIGISLLLSFIISSYQPTLDPLQSKYVNEVDIGGVEEKKRTIIQPTSLVFHIGNEILGFKDANERKAMYENMQQWLLSDYTPTKQTNLNHEFRLVDLSFPLEIPMQMASNMFEFKNEDILPTWSFKRIVITFNDSHSNLNVTFLSLDGEKAAQFVVSDSQVFSYLKSFSKSDKRLAQYTGLDSGQEPIYFPAEEVMMEQKSLAIEDIDPALLVNALFQSPSLVSHTIGENTYNDGQRGMTVLNDERSMEFINPIDSKEHIDFNDLIDLSINNINEHKGWTNEYILEDINFTLNHLHYKMYYDGYPVYSHHDYSTIEQQWQNHLLREYKRPLFRVSDLLNSKEVYLPSGKEVVEYLHEDDGYNIDDITDIRVGYRLKYEDVSYSVVLDPHWFIQYKDRWQEFRMTSSELPGKGGL